MRVLVTGHRGYVGGTLVPLLLVRGHQVLGIDTDFFRECTFSGQLSKVEEKFIDIRELAVKDLKDVDAIIHLAALCNDPLGDLDPLLTLEINHQATVHLARLAKQSGVQRFVFASSCSVYGAGGERWLDEFSELRPVTPYARSKMLAEHDLTQLADQTFCPVFLRAATAYGFSPKLRFDLVLNNLISWAMTTGRVRLKSDGTPWRPLVHVEDLGRAFVAALEAPSKSVHSRAFNVGRSEENFRILELAEQVANTLPGTQIQFAETVGPDQRCYRVNCDRVHRELPSFQPQWTVAEGISQLQGTLQGRTLSEKEFEGARFDRKAHLLKLQNQGLLDSYLRWSVDQPE